MHWCTKYIGLPYQNGGQGPKAFDCWALVRHVQREQFGLDLPAIYVDGTNQTAVGLTFELHEERKRWIAVDDPKEGDCVLVHKGRIADHVGIWLEHAGGVMLHALPRSGVVLTPRRTLERLGWNPILFYRYAGK